LAPVAFLVSVHHLQSRS